MPKTSLDTQSKYLWVILGRKNSPLKEDFKVYYERLKSWLDYSAETYAFIGHDKDIDDDGEVKFRHIHMVAVLKCGGTAPRLSTSLNRIADIANIPREDVDIEVADNVPQCVRYCLHVGYPNKHPYKLEELQTNLSADDLEPYLNEKNDSITASYLITCLKLCNYSCVAVLKSLGLKTYMKYRCVITDLIREYQDMSRH